MKNNFKFLAIGIFLLLIGLGLNQLTLAKLFPFLDPRLSLPREVLIALFNVSFSVLGILFIVFRNNKKKLLFSGVIFLCSLFIVLSGAELLVRIFSSTIDYYPITSPANPYKFGPPTGVIFKPDYQGVRKSKEFEAILKINSEGFRSSQEFIIGGQNQKTIAVLGDSITAALEVSEENTFVKLLESKLNNQGIKQVQNYGMPGTGIDYYLQTYRQYVRPHKPYLVVVAIFLNDIPDSDSFQAISSYSAYGFLNKADAFLQRHLALYKFIYLQYERSRLEVLHTFPKDGYLYEADWNNDTKEIYQKFSDKLSQLIYEIKKDGARPIIAWMPSYIESSDTIWQELEKSYNFIGGKNTLDRDKIRNGLGALTNEMGVELVDLSDIFRESYKSGKPLHYNYDRHFNPVGHQVVAEVLANKIIINIE